MSLIQTKYGEIRDRMKPGDVVAFSGKKAHSEIIKWATRSNVSHVGIVLQSRLIVDGEPKGRVFNQVMEATDSGVKLVNLSGKQQVYEGEIRRNPKNKTRSFILTLLRTWGDACRYSGKCDSRFKQSRKPIAIFEVPPLIETKNQQS